MTAKEQLMLTICLLMFDIIGKVTGYSATSEFSGKYACILPVECARFI